MYASVSPPSFARSVVQAPGEASRWRGALACLALSLLTGCFQADPEDLDLLHYAEPSSPAAGNGADRPVGGDSDDGAKDDAAARPVPLGFDCVSPVESDYHPAGYASSSVHGLDFKLQGDDCRSCHGPKLEGCDFAGGCDNCHDGGHPTGWRSDCTYCHGGASNETGAPPSDLVRAKPPSELSFLAHDAHVVGTLHAPYACSQCHVQPADVLSEGHAFDATPGRVEVTFSAGLSPDAAYDGNGGCSNLYCHGDRRVNGSVEHSAAATECNSCHAFDDARKLSGRHDAHVNGGLLGFLFDKVACSECHSAVIDLEGEIIGPDLHVNGQVDLSVAAQGITYDGTRCNGTCHGAPHTFISTWEP